MSEEPAPFARAGRIVFAASFVAGIAQLAILRELAACHALSTLGLLFIIGPELLFGQFQIFLQPGVAQIFDRMTTMAVVDEVLGATLQNRNVGHIGLDVVEFCSAFRSGTGGRGNHQ